MQQVPTVQVHPAPRAAQLAALFAPTAGRLLASRQWAELQAEETSRGWSAGQAAATTRPPRMSLQLPPIPLSTQSFTLARLACGAQMLSAQPGQVRASAGFPPSGQ